MERETQRNRMPNRVEDLVAFGEHLRQTRVLQGKSLREVAGEVGISLTYLLSIERAKNPKTGKPSLPSPHILGNLCTVLGILPGDNSLLQTEHTLPVQFLQIAASTERKKAADMVLRGEIAPQEQNEIFNYRLELAASYTSAAVAIEAVRDKLEKEIQELKAKYHIEEDQVMNKPEGLPLRAEDPRV